MQKRFKLTTREIILAIVFAILGFLVTTSIFLKFMNKLNPLLGLLFYYTIIFITVFILSLTGLTIGKTKIKDIPQIIGIAMIIFSFFIIFNFENQYVQYITTDSLDGASNIFYHSEDGVTWWAWYGITQSILASRILTFMVVPLTLTILGGLLVEKKIKLGVLH